MPYYKTDLQKAKEDYASYLDEKRRNDNQGKYAFFNFSEGETRIRVLPPWTTHGRNAYRWFNETYVHWGLPITATSKKEYMSTLCPKKMLGEPCYICDERSELLKSPDPSDIELADRVVPKKTRNCNILVKENDDKGTPHTVYRVARLPRDVFGNIQALFASEFGAIDDPEIGYDIYITRTGKNIDNTTYNVRVAKDPSHIKDYWGVSLKQLDEDLFDLDHLEELFPTVKFLTYEEQQRLWDGTLDLRTFDKTSRLLDDADSDVAGLIEEKVSGEKEESNKVDKPKATRTRRSKAAPTPVVEIRPDVEATPIPVVEAKSDTVKTAPDPVQRRSAVANKIAELAKRRREQAIE